MVVLLQIAIRDGWKQEDNNRFGQCLEIRFINSADNKIMFRYAPNLKDEPVWEELFSKLKAYDKMHKEIFNYVKTIDGEFYASSGVCDK